MDMESVATDARSSPKDAPRDSAAVDGAKARPKSPSRASPHATNASSSNSKLASMLADALAEVESLKSSLQSERKRASHFESLANSLQSIQTSSSPSQRSATTPSIDTTTITAKITQLEKRAYEAQLRCEQETARRLALADQWKALSKYLDRIDGVSKDARVRMDSIVDSELVYGDANPFMTVYVPTVDDIPHEQRSYYYEGSSIKSRKTRPRSGSMDGALPPSKRLRSDSQGTHYQYIDAAHFEPDPSHAHLPHHTYIPPGMYIRGTVTSPDARSPNSPYASHPIPPPPQKQPSFQQSSHPSRTVSHHRDPPPGARHPQHLPNINMHDHARHPTQSQSQSQSHSSRSQHQHQHHATLTSTSISSSSPTLRHSPTESRPKSTNSSRSIDVDEMIIQASTTTSNIASNHSGRDHGRDRALSIGTDRARVKGTLVPDGMLSHRYASDVDVETRTYQGRDRERERDRDGRDRFKETPGQPDPRSDSQNHSHHWHTHTFVPVQTGAPVKKRYHNSNSREDVTGILGHPTSLTTLSSSSTIVPTSLSSSSSFVTLPLAAHPSHPTNTSAPSYSTPPFPATNSKGERLCRQCGQPGRYKDGKCVEKWGPGPLGPGTVCDKCRKKMKRVERREAMAQAQVQMEKGEREAQALQMGKGMGLLRTDTLVVGYDGTTPRGTETGSRSRAGSTLTAVGNTNPNLNPDPDSNANRVGSSRRVSPTNNLDSKGPARMVQPPSLSSYALRPPHPSSLSSPSTSIKSLLSQSKSTMKPIITSSTPVTTSNRMRPNSTGSGSDGSNGDHDRDAEGDADADDVDGDRNAESVDQEEEGETDELDMIIEMDTDKGMATAEQEVDDFDGELAELMGDADADADGDGDTEKGAIHDRYALRDGDGEEGNSSRPRSRGDHGKRHGDTIGGDAEDAEVDADVDLLEAVDAAEGQT